MRYSNYLINENQSPLETHMYGGIPDGGGYGPATEYEIGHSRFAEAAHCILGSLCKMVNGSTMESSHIYEEFGIMQDCIDEYSRPLYVQRLKEYYDKDDEYKKYAVRTYNNLQVVSKKLVVIAKKYKDLLMKYQETGLIKDVAESCYNCIIRLANEAQLTTPEDWYFNTFKSTILQKDVDILNKRIVKLFK